jgi:hypothetical protein
MTSREVHILSYFSLPTDLAASLKSWPEFQDGNEYHVDLSDSRENGAVRLIEPKDESPYISVAGQGSGRLFDQVLGFVIHSLAAHSDSLMVDRVS